jgi:hypothetical protein
LVFSQLDKKYTINIDGFFLFSYDVRDRKLLALANR